MNTKNRIEIKAFDRTPRLAELKVSYRRCRRSRGKIAASPFVIVDSKSCEIYLRQIWNKDTIELREEFIVLCLNAANEVLGWINIASGGFSATVADPRIIFGVALQTASSSIIVAHNHPSGSPHPSASDIALTNTLKQALSLVDVRILDHFIIAGNHVYSFAEHGKL